MYGTESQDCWLHANLTAISGPAGIEGLLQAAVCLKYTHTRRAVVAQSMAGVCGALHLLVVPHSHKEALRSPRFASSSPSIITTNAWSSARKHQVINFVFEEVSRAP